MADMTEPVWHAELLKAIGWTQGTPQQAITYIAQVMKAVSGRIDRDIALAEAEITMQERWAALAHGEKRATVEEVERLTEELERMRVELFNERTRLAD